MTEIIHLSHTPPHHPLFITCFTHVTNAAFLRAQLLASNQAYNYAFIDASTILSRRHVLAACFRALNDHVHDRLRSNNVHSEIVFCLNPTSNIGEAFRRFGIQDTTTELVVVKVGGTDPTTSPNSSAETEAERETVTTTTRESVQSHLTAGVQGEQVYFNDEEFFGRTCDLERVRKTYKLGGNAKTSKQTNGQKVVNGGLAGRAMNEREEMEVQVLGLMALRGAT